MSRLPFRTALLLSLTAMGCEYQPIPLSPQESRPITQTRSLPGNANHLQEIENTPLSVQPLLEFHPKPLPDQQDFDFSSSLPDVADTQGGAGVSGSAFDGQGESPRGTKIKAVTYYEPITPIRSFHDWELREIAIDSLSRIGKAAVPKLIDVLRDPNPHHRVQAAKMLARIGPDADEAVNELVSALDDEDEEVRKAAVRALGQIGPPAAAAVEALIRVIEETTPIR